MYPIEGQAQPAILIHSPRTGRDVATSCRAAVSGENFNLLSPYGKRRGALVLGAKLFAISIPSPRTGRDGDFLCLKLKTIKFQSTLPTRGETVVNVIISIHSSHTGRDFVVPPFFCYLLIFQSTLPIREETVRQCSRCTYYQISIHSSHTGRDKT